MLAWIWGVGRKRKRSMKSNKDTYEHGKDGLITTRNISVNYIVSSFWYCYIRISHNRQLLAFADDI